MTDAQKSAADLLREAHSWHRDCCCGKSNDEPDEPCEETTRAIDAAVEAARKGMHAAMCSCHGEAIRNTRGNLEWECGKHNHPFVNPRCIAARKEAANVNE